MTPRPDLPLTGKQRGRAALEGRPVDRFPVTSIYNFLYYRDHFAELTGLPAWRLHAWAHASPEEHVTVFAQLLDQAPFAEHRGELAIRLVAAVSRESGPDEPSKGVFRDTAANTAFDTFDAERYLTTADMKTLREVAALAPYDTIVVMVNACRYGGGGIFGAYSIFSADSEYADYVLVHEFGHGFGALGDEYFNSATGIDEEEMYAPGVEPWEPNITAQTIREKVKWRHLIDPGTPVPTPDTDAYDGVIGVFEGAGYKAKGLYRPTRDGKMHHKGLLPFGPVNEAARVV